MATMAAAAAAAAAASPGSLTSLATSVAEGLHHRYLHLFVRCDEGQGWAGAVGAPGLGVFVGVTCLEDPPTGRIPHQRGPSALVFLASAADLGQVMVAAGSGKRRMDWLVPSGEGGDLLDLGRVYYYTYEFSDDDDGGSARISQVHAVGGRAGWRESLVGTWTRPSGLELSPGGWRRRRRSEVLDGATVVRGTHPRRVRKGVLLAQAILDLLAVSMQPVPLTTDYWLGLNFFS